MNDTNHMELTILDSQKIPYLTSYFPTAIVYDNFILYLASLLINGIHYPISQYFEVPYKHRKSSEPLIGRCNNPMKWKRVRLHVAICTDSRKKKRGQYNRPSAHLQIKISAVSTNRSLRSKSFVNAFVEIYRQTKGTNFVQWVAVAYSSRGHGARALRLMWNVTKRGWRLVAGRCSSQLDFFFFFTTHGWSSEQHIFHTKETWKTGKWKG